MIASVAIWFVKSVGLIGLTLLAFPLAPFLALFVTHEEESAVTGFPSLYPGKLREFLIPSLRIWQSPDAPLDEWWYGDYPSPLKAKYDQAYYDSHFWLRYVSRVFWLWRNAAYGFGARWGYADKGAFALYTKDNDKDWKSGKNVCSFWKVCNDNGDIGWLLRAQVYFYKDRCVEIIFGYKLLGDTVGGKKLVAIQFSPFKKYPE
jgi:hypothetical protein